MTLTLLVFVRRAYLKKWTSSIVRGAIVLWWDGERRRAQFVRPLRIYHNKQVVAYYDVTDFTARCVSQMLTDVVRSGWFKVLSPTIQLDAATRSRWCHDDEWSMFRIFSRCAE